MTKNKINLKTFSSILQYSNLISHNDLLLIAVSGGPDSLCLLHLLSQFKSDYNLKLHVGHLNHQLRGQESELDAEFVSDICDEWLIPCTIGIRDVIKDSLRDKIGVEEAARRARYEFLLKLANQINADKIMLGHHASDQTETVLMHLLRGSGLDGLRGMLRTREAFLTEKKIEKILVRPLLGVSRTAIEGYCQQNGIHPRLDSSNADNKYFRNRIRHEVIPYLDNISPGFMQRIGHLAEIVDADVELLDTILNEQWQDLLESASESLIELNIGHWRTLPLSLRRRSLRRAYSILVGSCQDLSFMHVEKMRDLAERGRSGKRVNLSNQLEYSLSDTSIRLARSHVPDPITIDVPILPESNIVVRLTTPGNVQVPGESHWSVNLDCVNTTNELLLDVYQNEDRWTAFLDADVVGLDVELRTRTPGERFRPLGMEGHSILISDFMVNERIPAQLRNRLPLVASVSGGEVWWIPGWRVSNTGKITAKTQRVLVIRFRKGS